MQSIFGFVRNQWRRCFRSLKVNFFLLGKIHYRRMRSVVTKVRGWPNLLGLWLPINPAKFVEIGTRMWRFPLVPVMRFQGRLGWRKQFMRPIKCQIPLELSAQLPSKQKHLVKDHVKSLVCGESNLQVILGHHHQIKKMCQNHRVSSREDSIKNSIFNFLKFWKLLTFQRCFFGKMTLILNPRR